MSYGGGQKMQPTASVLGTAYAPQMDAEGDENLGQHIEKEEERGTTLEQVQRLEDDMADKNKEIQQIKAKLVKDSKKSSPVIFFIAMAYNNDY